MPGKPNPQAGGSGRRRRPAPALHDLRGHKQHRPMMAELYRRAQARLRHQRKTPLSKTANPKADFNTQRLVHELEVHQIELELQNAELQKSRDELEVALEKYTDLYDFAPIGYFTTDESGVILEANLTGAALLGLERSRLIHQRLLHFVVAPSRPVVLDFLKDIFSGAKGLLCEALLRKADGEIFWAGLRATFAVSFRGDRKWCRVAVSDIGVRKQAQEVLRQNEALFSALIAQAPIGVYVVDARLCVQQVNPNALPIFRKVQPLIGRELSRVMRILWPRPVADELMEHFRHTLQTGQPFFSGDFSARRQDLGVQESYEWHLRRVTLPTAQHGVVCFINDLTERKRAEETQRRLAVLAASNQKLEQEILRRQAVEKALQQSEQHQLQLSQQARHLSHQILHAQEEERKRISRELHDEIAQTLVGINVHLAALTRETARAPAELRKKIVLTQQLVEKSVEVVRQFAWELRPTALDDLGLIPALHTFMREFSKRNGIHVRLTAFAAIEKLGIAKRTVLYRVAHEALNNVARHAQASRVEVRIERLPNCICLKIRDDGKSFEAQKVMLARGSKRMGLLGMRERLEMVGGHLEIKSAPGKGTTIIAQIPPDTRRGGG